MPVDRTENRTETGITQGIVRVDGASLYYERRGNGPALPLVSPGLGEAGSFSRVADLLAGDHTVLALRPARHRGAPRRTR